MTALDYTIRPYQDKDISEIPNLGEPYWWNPRGPSLHLVAALGDQVAAHLHVTNRGLPEPTRRPGETEMRLTVAPAHRWQGIAGALFERVKWFAVLQRSTHITASYLETEEGKVAEGFLTRRGFQPYERFISLRLDPADFDPAPFTVADPSVRIASLEELGDTAEIRRQLYDLESRARTTQPFRKVGAYVPDSFEEWEQAMNSQSPDAVFVAMAEDQPVGMIKGLSWGFAGVDPGWRGKGIATALKVYALTVAKARGIERVYTENHEDNAAMLAINRKLGYQLESVEVNCMLKF